MRKVLMPAAALLALLCACAPAEGERSAPDADTQPAETAIAVKDIALFVPDGSGGMDIVSEERECIPADIVARLTELGALPEGSALNSMRAETVGEKTETIGTGPNAVVRHTLGRVVGHTLDMNAAFAEGLRAMEAEEALLSVAALVNTMAAYCADGTPITLTIGGAPLSLDGRDFSAPTVCRPCAGLGVTFAFDAAAETFFPEFTAGSYDGMDEYFALLAEKGILPAGLTGEDITVIVGCGETSRTVLDMPEQYTGWLEGQENRDAAVHRLALSVMHQWVTDAVEINAADGETLLSLSADDVQKEADV